jgi:hypothetical protein
MEERRAVPVRFATGGPIHHMGSKWDPKESRWIFLYADAGAKLQTVI